MADPDMLLKLQIPARDEPHPDLSIVIPAMNEELTIREFISWCHEGLAKAQIPGEILIVDSSTDKTPDIALECGARVLKAPCHGLGHAYMDAIPYIRGKYVILGDCDCTYDFREIRPFIEKLSQGYDFVMGTRMKGTIEPESMPALHQYFGTPITTFLLNCIYRSPFSDIHCGMRAITLDAFKKINLESPSWEYASEMVIKSQKLNLKCTEVPIHFLKEPEGRCSHHKRIGWLSPWFAGWINLKVMFIYAPDFFLYYPGMFMLIAGIILLGSLIIGPIGFLSIHSMIFSSALTIIGFSFVQNAVLSKIYYNFDPEYTKRVKRFFTYNRGILLSFVLFILGVGLVLPLIDTFFVSDFSLSTISRPAIVGFTFIALSIQTFTYTLLFQMIAYNKRYYQV